jgi:hypothetical protein
MFKDRPGAGLCDNCHDHSTTVEGTCRCVVGYTPSGDPEIPCKPCASGTYKVDVADSECQDCTDNAITADTGSTKKSSCDCKAGYGGLYGDVQECTECGADTWKAVGRGRCEECPENSSSGKGSVEKKDCECDDGYERDGNYDCQACEKGEYMKSSSCESCQANTYTDVTAATACEDCPPGTESEEGSDENIDCECKAGYTAYKNGVECDMCGYGKYKINPGVGDCEGCPSGSTTTQKGSVAKTNCKCRAGYSGPDGGDCTICDAGTYKKGGGSEGCSSCPDGTSSAAGSTKDADCISCAPGYTKYGSATCDKCPAGTFKTAPGTEACGKCPDNSDSAKGSTQKEDCTCVPGHTAEKNGVDCKACYAGTSNSKGGTHICTSCGTNAESIEGSAACQCSAGFTPNGDECTKCKANSYKVGAGNSTCMSCPDYTSSAVGSKQVKDCKCLVGYTAAFDGVKCTACDEGTFKDNPGTGTCVDCLPGTYKATPGSGTCAACPPNTESAGKSNKRTDCKCVAGYTAVEDGMDCTACAEGTFKDWPGSGSCSGCPDGTGSDEGSGKLTDCKCLVDHSGDADGVECQECPGEAYKSLPGIGSCSKCQAGEKMLKDGSCKTCVEGTYNDVSGGSECRTCLAGSDSTARSSECSMCDIGMYNPTEGGACTGCPPGTTTAETGSTKEIQCKCKAGHFGGLDGKPCQKCAVGTVKPWEGNGICTDCKERTFNDARGAVECTPCAAYEDSPAGSTQCYCIPSTNRVGGVCSECFGCNIKVIFQATMAMTLQEFDNAAQLSFKEGVAKGLSVKPTEVSLTVTSGATRRLLQGEGIAVEATVSASPETAARVKTIISSGALSTTLQAIGLTGVVVDPIVASVALDPLGAIITDSIHTTSTAVPVVPGRVVPTATPSPATGTTGPTPVMEPVDAEVPLWIIATIAGGAFFFFAVVLVYTNSPSKHHHRHRPLTDTADDDHAASQEQSNMFHAVVVDLPRK